MLYCDSQEVIDSLSLEILQSPPLHDNQEKDLDDDNAPRVYVNDESVPDSVMDSGFSSLFRQSCSSLCE